ncbi:hypothetical protein [Burkholderia vietnamiensis]|uniref:hypothetical protein n=1 Tax=Burkholderia vietnamiensis TaxID=60552 RepID=UPI001CF2D532|nr:hypothetical protein [Burkholderia vietnamiensis]MCA8228309.1 hypothetical protein [Burkholderia vietnamiensis]
MKKYAPVVMLALASLANAQGAIKPVATPDAARLQTASRAAPMTAEQANAILAQLVQLNNTETQILQATLASQQRPSGSK